MRVILDVNILIRLTLGSPSMAQFFKQLVDLEYELLTSESLMHEFSETARKPRLAAHVDWSVYNQLIAFFAFWGQPVSVSPPYPSCRDSEDGYLLAMADAGKADSLVTLDKDLLEMKSHGNCIIETPIEFALRLNI